MTEPLPSWAPATLTDYQARGWQLLARTFTPRGDVLLRLRLIGGRLVTIKVPAQLAGADGEQRCITARLGKLPLYDLPGIYARRHG